MRYCIWLIALTIAAAAPGERVVDDRPGAIVINGAPATLRVDPAAPGLPLLAPELAMRLKLHGGGMLAIGVAYHVGDVQIPGRTQVVRFAGGLTGNQRTAWTERPYARDVDVVVGPLGVPEPIVRFAWRSARPVEVTAALPMSQEGGLFAHFYAASAVIDVGGAPLRVRFDPRRARTTATAGAAMRIAAAFGGVLVGEPSMAEIAFGVERPVRPMRLATPLAVGPLSVTTLLVRGPAGGRVAVPEAGAPPPDPDEVVVTARGKRDPRHDLLILGADVLDRCSALVFDKPARQVRLACG